MNYNFAYSQEALTLFQGCVDGGEPDGTARATMQQTYIIHMPGDPDLLDTDEPIEINATSALAAILAPQLHEALAVGLASIVDKPARKRLPLHPRNRGGGSGTP